MSKRVLSCPTCAQPHQAAPLRTGPRPWPCPRCGTPLRMSAWNSPWLWLATAPAVAGLVLGLFPDTAGFAHWPWPVLYLALSATGLWQALRRNRLLRAGG